MRRAAFAIMVLYTAAAAAFVFGDALSDPGGVRTHREHAMHRKIEQGMRGFVLFLCRQARRGAEVAREEGG